MKLQYNFYQLKTSILSLFFLFTTSISCFAQPFITTWKTDNTMSWQNTTITIPTVGTGYNYDVDWDNDGVFDEFGITGNVTHDFGVSGTYTIAIQGDFPRIYFYNSGEELKLLSIDQWGSNVWTSMEYAFTHCNNLTIPATDNPNLSMVTNMDYMFTGVRSFNQDIGSWNVSNVKNMEEMFFNAYSFSQNLGNWNVSTVVSYWMRRMLSNSGISIANYDNTLIGWENQGISNKKLGSDGLKYCASDSIRTGLINNHGWTITGDTYDCIGVNTTLVSAFEVFEIYPNPTKGQFFINAEFENPLNNVQIEIINTNGQIVEKIVLGNNISSIQETMNLSSIPKGSYYVLIRSEIEQIGKMILVD